MLKGRGHRALVAVPKGPRNRGLARLPCRRLSKTAPVLVASASRNGPLPSRCSSPGPASTRRRPSQQTTCCPHVVRHARSVRVHLLRPRARVQLRCRHAVPLLGFRKATVGVWFRYGSSRTSSCRSPAAAVTVTLGSRRKATLPGTACGVHTSPHERCFTQHKRHLSLPLLATERLSSRHTRHSTGNENAAQGHAAAKQPRYLGWWCETGRVVPKDEAKAVEWYAKAAEQGGREDAEQSPDGRTGSADIRGEARAAAGKLGSTAWTRFQVRRHGQGAVEPTVWCGLSGPVVAVFGARNAAEQPRDGARKARRVSGAVSVCRNVRQSVRAAMGSARL